MRKLSSLMSGRPARWISVLAIAVLLLACTATPQPTHGQSGTRVRDIQGRGHISPLAGKTVSNVPCIVTAVLGNGFYCQDPQPDDRPGTSEGLFVFTNVLPDPKLGDSVLVGGTVTEFRHANAGGDLTTTELTRPIKVNIVSKNNSLPPPVIIGKGGRVPPAKVIDDDVKGDAEKAGTFDPEADGLDFYESLESMLVQVNQAVVVGPTNRFGEIWTLADGGAGVAERTVRGGIIISADDYNPERILLDDEIIKVPPTSALMPMLNVGDRITNPVVGIMDYAFSNFRIQTTAPLRTASGGLAREAAKVAKPDQLSVATFNVQNLSPLDPASKFAALAAVVVNNLRSPDILAVEEIQDNNGASDDGTVDASQTIGNLIAAIHTAGGPAYHYRQIDPANKLDGGEPGGNIRQIFLFDPLRVTFVDQPGGTTQAATKAVNKDGKPQLSFSPGRLDPTNPAFENSRKPLVGEFLVNGQAVFIIANHLNSKGGDQPLFGRFQPPTLGSEAARLKQVGVLRGFVKSLLAIDANANVVVLGDLNDFEFSKPLLDLKGDFLNNLVEILPKNERYSYVYQGNSQVLDQILVSNNLLKNAAPEYDVVHVNAEFAVNTSDHDPSLARFILPRAAR